MSADGTFSFPTLGPLTDGSYQLTAVAKDAVGNRSRVTQVTLTIDTQVPSAPSQLALSYNTDTGRSRTDRLTRMEMPTIIGTAEPNATISLFDGDDWLGEEIADSTGKWQVALEVPLLEGTAQLHAVMTDAAGNVGAASPPVTITVDQTPPAAPTVLVLVSASDTGNSSSDRLTQDSSPTLAGQVAPGHLVQLFWGQKLVGETTADATGTWQATVSYLPDGVQTLVAVAYDDAANQSAAATLDLTIDATPPDFSIVSLYSNREWVAGDRLTGWAINAGTPISQITYQIVAPTNAAVPLVSQTVAVAPDGTFNVPVDFTGLTVGQSYQLLATATDAAGNTTTRTFDFQYGSPSVSPITPRPGDTSSAGSYRDRLSYILTEAIANLSGNRQAALQQAFNTLVDLGWWIEPAGTQDEMAGVLNQLFVLAQPPMTQGAARAIGRVYANQWANSEESILVEVMQAKLLATALQVPELVPYLPTGTTDTPLSTALKDLAKTYIATRDHPTIAPNSSSSSPNLLTQIWNANSRSGLATAATALKQAVEGVTDPTRAVQMVDRLLSVSQQTPTVQAQIHNEEISSSLVDLGFAYARLNLPTVTDADLLAQLPFQQLWQATTQAEVQAAQPGIQSFFAGFTGLSQQRTLLKYEAQLVDQLRDTSLLSPEQKQNPVQINNAISAGTWFVSPRLPSPATRSLNVGQPVASASAGTGAAAIYSALSSGEVTPLSEPTLSPTGSVVPALPSEGAVPYGPFPNYGNSPFNSFFGPDGRPRYYSELLKWRLHVPVLSHWTGLYTGNWNRPNAFWKWDVVSYGGVQIKQIKQDNNRTVEYEWVNLDGTLTVGSACISCYFPTGLQWGPELGYGFIEFLGPIDPDAPLPPGAEAWALPGNTSSNSGNTSPAGDGKYDPYWQPPGTSSPPPGTAPSPPWPGPGWILPGADWLPPGSDLIPTPGGFVPGDGSKTPSYDGPPPDYPPDCSPRGLSKPIAEMNELEILLETLSRVPCELGSELREEVKNLLSNPGLIAIMAVLLVAISMISAPLAALIVSFAGLLGLKGDLDNLAKFLTDMVAAKRDNQEGYLDSAAKSLALVLASYGAGKLDKFADFLKSFKALIPKAPFGLSKGLVGTIKLVEIVGLDKAMSLLDRFPLAQFGDRLGKVAEQLFEVEKNEKVAEAVKKFPEAIGAIIEVGPGAVGTLTKYGAREDILTSWMKILAKDTDEGAKLLHQTSNVTRRTAQLGTSTRVDYRKTFFSEYPTLEGEVVVHHAVEQKVLNRYPGIITASELHSLENLRGIPKNINSEVHLRRIYRIWDAFYEANPNPTRQQLLDQATAVLLDLVSYSYHQ